MRLIDADVLIEFCAERWIPLNIDAVNMQPTIQPEPQEGYWINGKCDLCGEHAPFWCMASTYHESNYCPKCGAKMKGAAT